MIGEVLKSVNAENGNSVKLTTIEHKVFGDVYYIYINGEIVHTQYGTRRLDAHFNECVTGDWDLMWNN